MKEKLKGFWGKTKEKLQGLKNLSRRVLIAIAAGVVAVVALIIIAVVALNNRPYATLVTGVSSEEASSILAFLTNEGVTDYKIENNDTILVPASQEASLKARILMEGYLQTGFAYSSYYDKIGALSTESERNQAFIIALQEKLEAVIRCFDNVQDAYVQITPGEDRGYVLDSGNVVNATASVTLVMRGVSTLTTEQAGVIRNLVSHSVQGLTIDSVTIGDTRGGNYDYAVDATADTESSALKFRLEQEQENKIRAQVLETLVPFYGEDNVKVGVNVVVEVAHSTIDDHDVHLPEWAQDGSTDGKGIVGTILYDHEIVRGEDTVPGGVVGAETNADLPEYVERGAEPDGNEQRIHVSGQTDMNNSETNTYTIRTAAYVSDCTVGVSINSTTAGTVNVPEIQQLVARTAGIVGTVDEATGQENLDGKVSVVTGPFYEEPVAPPAIEQTILGIPVWMLIAAAAGLLLFIILLIVILSIRRRKRRKRQEEEEAQEREMDALLAAAGLMPEGAGGEAEGADVMDIEIEKNMELRKEIRKFVEENPEIAAQVIRNWVRGGENDG